MATNKTPIHKHAHPAYSWLALVVSVMIILGVAGWCYATYSQSLDSDLVLNAKSLALPQRSVSSTNTLNPVSVATEIGKIDSGLDTVSDTDFSDAQMDNTILGVQ